MGSLAAEIAKLTDPTPDIEDPEDGVNIESLAKLSDKFDDDDVDVGHQISSLRALNAPLLDELDQRYAGKKIARKNLDDSYDQGSFGSEEYSSSDDGSQSDEDSAYSDDDEQLAIFKQRLNKREEKGKSHLESSEQGKDLENVPDSTLDAQEDVLDEEDENSESDEDEEESEDEDDHESGEDIVQKFSQFNVDTEIERGKAVKRQQNLWNKLCECRIKLQKLLVTVNRLPQHDTWQRFKEESDKTYSASINKGCKSVANLLDSLLQLQSELWKNDPDFKAVSSAGASKNPADDEEIPSDTEDEKEDEHMKDVNENEADLPSEQVKAKTLKRKLKLEDYEEVLSKHHKSLVPYRNSIIQKWDDKTRLSAGKMTQKSFNAFDQSALKQIDQILQDKPRLIRRTQLKRSLYTIVGKTDTVNLNECQPTDEDEEDKEESKKDPLKDYDPEIFDDDDFYRKLLKDIIETKSIGMDPLMLSKHMEIQKVRSKMKRKVDTKASKGRKIRFSVHPKLVNFMAPVVNNSMSEEARNELFRSLFGQCHAALNS